MTAPRFAAGARFARETCLEIAHRACMAGVADAQAFWRMTPAELSASYAAAREGELQRLRALDTLAWLVGQYVAVALNAPKRYPAQPNRVRARAATDEEMRRVMEGIARKGEANEFGH